MAGLAWLLPAHAHIFGKIAWLVMLIYAGPGVLCAALMIHGQLIKRSFVVTQEHLEKVTDYIFWRRRRRWPREQLVCVRLGERIDSGGDRSLLRDVVEVVHADGRRDVVQYGGVFALQRLADALRNALGLPAGNAAVPLGPQDAAWRSQDEPAPPENWPYLVTQTADGFVAEKPAEGARWPRRNRFVASCSILFATAPCLAGVFLIPLIPKPDDQKLAWIVAGLFTLFGAVFLLFAVYEAFEKHSFTAAPGEVAFQRHFIFGNTRRTWLTRDLLAIGIEPQFVTNPNGDFHLVLTTFDHKIVRILTGKPETMRHLATLLRQATGLPRDGV